MRTLWPAEGRIFALEPAADLENLATAARLASLETRMLRTVLGAAANTIAAVVALLAVLQSAPSLEFWPVDAFAPIRPNPA